MTHWRSHEYHQIADRVSAEYNPRTWEYARRWLARVGLRRIIADEALLAASGLLKSINRATYKSDPELDALLVQARDILDRLAGESCHKSWLKFQGKRS